MAESVPHDEAIPKNIGVCLGWIAELEGRLGDDVVPGGHTSERSRSIGRSSGRDRRTKLSFTIWPSTTAT